MLKRLPIIGVMGASAAAHEAWAEPLGCAIAENGWHVLTGGGAGVMESVSRAFVSVEPRAGSSIGILPTRRSEGGGFAVMESYPNPYVEVPIITNLGLFDGTDPDQVSRNFINVLSAQVVVALPGSKGTRNEVALALRFRKPLILFGPQDAFADFSPTPVRAQKLEDVLDFIKTELQKLPNC